MKTLALHCTAALLLAAPCATVHAGSVTDALDPALVTPADTGTNLVTNPGFETGDFTGYTVTQAADGTGIGVTGGNTHSGSFSAVFEAVGGEPDTISQTLATVPGATYTVSFYLESFAGDGGGETETEVVTPAASSSFEAFTATFGSTTVFSETNAGTVPYTQYSANVVATGTSTVLSFAGYNGPSEDNLDDISVTQVVPEPGTWALVGVGAAGLGMVALRRRLARA